MGLIKTAAVNPRCSPDGRPYPAPLADSSERWFRTYKTLGAEAAYRHAKRTVDLCIGYGIIEPDRITDRKTDPIQLNQKLANVAFAHVFLDTAKNRARFPAEDFAYHPLIVEGFETFDRLRSNDLGAQERNTYDQLLAKPSLGTLVRLADLIQYHKERGPVSEKELARLDPAVFYFYKDTTGKTEYQRIAKVAHSIYGPLAEYFGFTKQLAGDLDQMSYSLLKPSFYNEVVEGLSMIHPYVKATNRIMHLVTAQLEHILLGDGYDCDINVRDHKHLGRVLEKIDRKLKARKARGVPYHLARLGDLAAFTVVLHSHRDEAVKESDLRHFQRVASIIIGLVRGAVTTSGIQYFHSEQADHISNPKANGYQSLHLDMKFQDLDKSPPTARFNCMRLVGLEAIIRNTQMDKMAREGGAAHYLYKGAGPEFETARKNYTNVKDAILAGLRS